MIKCPNCTGELHYNPGDKVVKCEYCGSSFNPDELNEKVKYAGKTKNNSDNKKNNGEIDAVGYTCSQCGATLLTFDDTAITFCSYCGSQAMLEEKMMKINNPDFVIPFEKTKEEAISAYKKKVSKALFLPNYLKSNSVLEKFRGIYIPYVVYKLACSKDVENKGSKYSHRSGDYVYYDDYKISSFVDASYEGMSYDLISKFYDKFSMAIPHNFKKIKDFNPNYLIGYYADVGDIDESTYDNDVKNMVNKDGSLKLKKYPEFSRYGCYNPTVNLEVADRKKGMFPVYFLSVRNSDNKTITYAVVNGENGDVVAELPVSFPKYILASLILSPFIYIIIDKFLKLTPMKVIIFSVIASVLSLILSSVQAFKLKKHNSFEDDLGRFSISSKTKKIHTIQYFIKEILALILTIGVIILHPVNDIYYYIVSIISLLLVLLSFYDLVHEHNLLCMNPLPQLEKRGGDK